METITNTTSSTTAAARVAPAAAMRAVLQSGYGGTEVLRLGTTTRPAPGPGEVLVQVRAAGLDRGTWHLMTGRPYLMRVMGFGFSAPKNPVAGLDLAGTIVAVGPDVSRFCVGDEVFGLGKGSFAEYATAHEDKLAKKPARLSFEEAAVLGVSGITALQALTSAGNVASGERVLIVGASGGVGSYAVQIAKALGAEVTGVCSTPKVDLVRTLGADRVLDYRTQDFTAGSARYDLILDIGGNTPLARLRRVMTPAGRLVFVGGENGGDITAGMGRVLRAMVIAPFVKQRFTPLTSREHFAYLEPLAALANDGKVRPAIDRRCTLAEVAAAIGDLEGGRVTGKVVVVIG